MAGVPRSVALHTIALAAVAIAVASAIAAWWLADRSQREDVARFQAAQKVFITSFSAEYGRYRTFAQNLANATFRSGNADESAWENAVRTSEWRDTYPHLLAVALLGAPDATRDRRAPLLWSDAREEVRVPASGSFLEEQPPFAAGMATARAANDSQGATLLDRGRAVLFFAKFRDAGRSELLGYVACWFDADGFANAPLPPGAAGWIEKRAVPYHQTPALGLWEKNIGLGGGGLNWRFVTSRGPELARQSSRWLAWLVLGVGSAGALIVGLFGWREARARFAAEQARGEVAALNASLEAEREVVKLKSAFVNTVSHEFRTPLSVIISSAELLESYHDRLTPGRRAEHLCNIRNSSRRMAEMVEHILLLGRIESGRTACSPVPLDLVALARAIADEAKSATHGRCPIEITTRELEGARADEALLRHILGNLLGNAVKYSPQGAPVALHIAREGDAAVFTIADHGLGIEDTSRLGEPFHRGANATHIPGTGLGWVIVKRAIELHGGTFAVQSEAGDGTRVTVRLPLFRS